MIKDITGNTYGKWTVKSFAKSVKGKALWNCSCECGIESIVRGDHLRGGKSTCCINCSTKPTIHGHNSRKYRTPTYRTWYAMIQRCTNPNYKYYYLYGGRGITVCERWRDFTNFLADMGERPEGLTIERIDNDKGYYLDNCKWATIEEQNRNKRPKGSAKIA